MVVGAVGSADQYHRFGIRALFYGHQLLPAVCKGRWEVDVSLILCFSGPAFPFIL